MKTLDSILKSFNKTVKQLDNLSEDIAERVHLNEEKIEELEVSNSAMYSEKSKVDTIRGNLKSLLGE